MSGLPRQAATVLQIEHSNSRRIGEQLHVAGLFRQRLETGNAKLRPEADPSKVGLQRSSQEANEFRPNVLVALAVDKIHRVLPVEVI